jgi:hypothetical protein
MRSVLMSIVALGVATACGSSSPPPSQPAPPVPTNQPVVEARTPTCADAAFGIEAASKDMRPAEQEIVPVVRTKCLAEAWSVAAIACFAKLRASDDMLTCTDHLTPDARTSLLAEIGGTSGDATTQTAELAEVKQKLATVTVGIASCDQFVQEVVRVMDCEGISLPQRILLGTETAEAWSISTARLTISDKARMGTVCGKSLDKLQKHATNQSC